MIRRPPRSTQSRSSAASDVYKRQVVSAVFYGDELMCLANQVRPYEQTPGAADAVVARLSLIHISEPTRLGMISYAVFCLKKKKETGRNLVCRLLLKKIHRRESDSEYD